MAGTSISGGTPQSSLSGSEAIPISGASTPTATVTVVKNFVNSPTTATTGGLLTAGLGSLVNGTLYTTGVYTGVALTGGTGTGALATISVGPYTGAATPIGVASVVITTPGTGYVVGDVLSAAAANIGGTGSGFTVTVKYISPASTLVNDNQTGVNGSASMTTRSGSFSNTRTGTTGKNVAIYAEASGATGTGSANYAVQASGEINVVNTTTAARKYLSVNTADGVQHGNLNFTVEEGTMNADGVRDAVAMIGWNTDGAGAAEVFAEAAMWESFERHYLPYGITTPYNVNFERIFSTSAYPIITTTSITGGSAYTSGTYTNVAITGGSAPSGMAGKATIVVSGGAVTSVTMTSPGVGYRVGDVLSAAAANIGGTGSGFSFTITGMAGTVTRHRMVVPSKFIGQTDAAKYAISTIAFNTVDSDEWRVASTASGNSAPGTAYFSISPNAVTMSPVNGQTTTFFQFESVKTTAISGSTLGMTAKQVGQADDTGIFTVTGFNGGQTLSGSGSNVFGLTINNTKASTAVNSGLSFQLQSALKAIIEFCGATNGNASFANNMLFYVAPTTSGFTWYDNFGVAMYLSAKANLQIGTATVVSDVASLYVTGAALSSAWLPSVSIAPPAHTAMTAGSEKKVMFIAGSAQTWAGGSATLATQRYTHFGSPTVNAGAGNTFTDTFNVSIDDPTNGSGTTTNLYSLGVGKLRLGGIPKFAGTNTTGAGSALLGANSPATTNTAPYTWIQIVTSDGSTAYIPAWK